MPLVITAPTGFIVVAGRLIDRVISQMHIHVSQVLLIWRLKLACRQPAKTLLVKVNAQGVNTTQQDINPQIKLQVVDKEGPIKVPLHHILLIGRMRGKLEIAQTLRQEDPTTLRGRLWLGNKSVLWGV